MTLTCVSLSTTVFVTSHLRESGFNSYPCLHFSQLRSGLQVEQLAAQAIHFPVESSTE